MSPTRPPEQRPQPAIDAFLAATKNDRLLAKGLRSSDAKSGRTGEAPASADYPASNKSRLTSGSPSRLFSRQRLRAGETVYTGWCALAAPIVAEPSRAKASTPSRIDQQHGLWDTAATVTAIAAIRAAGAAPVVRVPLGDSRWRAACSISAPKASSRR